MGWESELDRQKVARWERDSGQITEDEYFKKTRPEAWLESEAHQSVLTKMGVKHTAMIHPAARGTIRRKSNYSQHVEEVLAVVKGSKPQRE